MVNSTQVQHGGLNIVHMRPACNRRETKLVSLAMHDSFFHTSASKPHGEGVNMVVAAHQFSHLTHGRAAEFSTPHHQRVFQQAPPLQVQHQCGAGTVGLETHLFQGATQMVHGVAMVVPIGVVKLHEAHTALNHATGQHAVVGK